MFIARQLWHNGRMAMFVHLAAESTVDRIQRNGISRLRRSTDRSPGGIYAVPVTQNFYLSHQWLRELKRRNRGPIAAVYFRLPDDQAVFVGRYNESHRPMSAAEAVGEFMACQNAEGWEVIIPRRVDAREIHRVRTLRQIFGWRYFPGSHGRRPCPCPYCTRGEYGAAGIRRRLGDA